MTTRFEYPFTSRYATVDGVRLHYLDEGEGLTIRMQPTSTHSVPSWSTGISRRW